VRIRDDANDGSLKRKAGCRESDGAGRRSVDRTRPPKITFDAVTSEWGVFEFVNEGTVASGIVDFAANSDWQFSAEPSTLVGHSYKAPVCMVGLKHRVMFDWLDEVFGNQR
jgi:hypothetical protein